MPRYTTLFDTPPPGVGIRNTNSPLFKQAKHVYHNLIVPKHGWVTGVRAAELSVLVYADPLSFVLIGLMTSMKFKNKFEFYTRVLIRKMFQIYYCPPKRNIYYKSKPYYIIVDGVRHDLKEYYQAELGEDYIKKNVNPYLHEVRRELRRFIYRLRR